MLLLHSIHICKQAEQKATNITLFYVLQEPFKKVLQLQNYHFSCGIYALVNMVKKFANNYSWKLDSVFLLKLFITNPQFLYNLKTLKKSGLNRLFRGSQKRLLLLYSKETWN